MERRDDDGEDDLGDQVRSAAEILLLIGGLGGVVFLAVTLANNAKSEPADAPVVSVDKDKEDPPPLADPIIVPEPEGLSDNTIIAIAASIAFVVVAMTFYIYRKEHGRAGLVASGLTKSGVMGESTPVIIYASATLVVFGTLISLVVSDQLPPPVGIFFLVLLFLGTFQLARHPRVMGLVADATAIKHAPGPDIVKAGVTGMSLAKYASGNVDEEKEDTNPRGWWWSGKRGWWSNVE